MCSGMAAAGGVGPSSGRRLEEPGGRRGRFALKVGNIVLKRLRGKVGEFVGISQRQLGCEGCEGEMLKVGRGPVFPACLVGMLFVCDVHCLCRCSNTIVDIGVVGRQR